MIRYHPPIREENIGPELHCYHLWINLDNNAFQPASDPFAAFFMVTENLDGVANLVFVFIFRWFHEWHCAHFLTILAFPN
ncbi:MAG TPA: hypothetical protein PKK59_00615 [Anaerolineaceae bacterium]|nr:hypothetical protein [Anaerolineaceae bacterium]